MSFAARQVTTSEPWAGAAIAVATFSAPYVSVYPWGNGFGSKYADPSVLVGSAAYKPAFAPSGNALAVVHQDPPFVSAYAWNAGFGTKYANPSVLPTLNSNDVAFNPAGTVVAVAHDATPYISVYAWNDVTGFGTKYTDPATLPTGDAYGVSFSAGGGDIAIAHENSPYVTTYAFSAGAGFIAKYADPATLPTGDGSGIAFRRFGGASVALAVAHNTSPYVSVYAWSGGGGFGSKFANPAVLPNGNARSVAWSPSGGQIAVSSAATPPFLSSNVSVYAWSSGFGSRYADPVISVPGGTSYDVAFSGGGDAIALAGDAYPYLVAYRWSAGGWGSRYADPAISPNGTAYGVAWKA